MGHPVLRKKIISTRKRRINKQINKQITASNQVMDSCGSLDYTDRTFSPGASRVTRGASHVATPRMFNKRTTLRRGQLRGKIRKISKT